MEIKGTPREKALIVFYETFRIQKGQGKILELDIHDKHDIHAYFRLGKDQDKVIHVQAYPGMSTEKEMHVWARLLDYNEMMQWRKYCSVSIGNEHEATIRNFQNFGSGIRIPYDNAILEKLIAENMEELR